MDERTLTAWLITQGFLQPDKVKTVLEEQLRLSQKGNKLDIIGVARQLDLLTDAQVVEVLERTGYTPQSGPSTLAIAASQEISAVGRISDAGAVESALGSQESQIAPVDAAGAGAEAAAWAGCPGCCS